jgi:HlyD family secretion protein
MTANVIFTVARAENTLKIPNAALRYRPADKSPEEMLKLLTFLSGVALADTHQNKPSMVEKLEHNTTATEESRGPRSSDKEGSGESQQRCNAEHSGRMPAGAAGNPNRPDKGGSIGSQNLGAQAVIKPSTNNRYSINPGVTVHFPQAEIHNPVWSLIWVLDHGQPQPRRVKLGITDGKGTAVLDGELKEGDTVIAGELMSEETLPQQTAFPFRGHFSGPPFNARSSGEINHPFVAFPRLACFTQR